MYRSKKKILRNTLLTLLFASLPLGSAIAASPSQTESLGKTSTTAQAVETDAETEIGVVQDQEVEVEQTPATEKSLKGDRRFAGVVKSFNGETLVVRLDDGSCETLTVAPEVLGDLNLTKGSLVVVERKDALVTKLQQPKVEQTMSGVVTNIVDDQVTVKLPNGETEGTTIAPETAKRLGLAPGVPINVTTYAGIPTTKVCLGERPRSQPPVVAPPPPPAAVPVTPTEPVRALW